MEPGDEWTAALGVVSKGLCRDWPTTREAVERYAAQERVRVDRAIAEARQYDSPPSDALLDRAVRSYVPRLHRSMVGAVKPFAMNVGLEARGHEGWRLAFRTDAAPHIVRGLAGDEDETLTLEPSELWSIVEGRCSWEDVWYGYRLHVRKREGAGYFRAFWEMLLGCDNEALGRQTRAELAG